MVQLCKAIYIVLKLLKSTKKNNHIMNNFFYLFGILYFVISVYNFFSYDHRRDVSIDAETNISELVDNLNKKRQNKSQRYYPRRMFALLFFVWTCIGYYGNFFPKELFLLNLIILISNGVILIFMGLLLALKVYSVLEKKEYLFDKEKKKKYEIPLTKIVYLLESVIVGSIIIIHYFII